MFSFLILCFLQLLGSSPTATESNNCQEEYHQLRNTSHLSLYQESNLEEVNNSGIDLSFSKSDFPCLIDRHQHCMSGSFCNRTARICQCKNTIHDFVRCDRFGRINGILDCTCLTYDPRHCKTQVGQCVLNCEQHRRPKEHQVDFPYHYIMPNLSDWSKKLCNKYNRTGTLCGRCWEGFHLLSYSFNLHCVQCNGRKINWMNYILSAFLPLTIFCFIILIFNINVQSSKLQGYIILSQCVSSTMFLRVGILLAQKNPELYIALQLLGSLYGFWNLDFFRLLSPGICLQISTLAVTSLDLLVALYPMGLMVVVYLMVKLHDRRLKILTTLWRPFSAFLNLFHSHWDAKTSLIDAFSTFLFLSNLKLLNSCYDLLVPVKVYHFVSLENVSYDYKLFYDATIHYFGREHLPYALISIILANIFVLLPIICLCMNQIHCFQGCLNWLPYRWQILFHTMMDSIQGCYKNGRDPGGRDYRWFSALPFIVRLILYLVSAITLDAMLFPYISMIFVMTAILVLICDPFKSEFATHTSILTAFMIMVACGNVVIVGHIMTPQRKDMMIASVAALIVIFTLPVLFISILILHWIFVNRRLCRFAKIRQLQ